MRQQFFQSWKVSFLCALRQLGKIFNSTQEKQKNRPIECEKPARHYLGVLSTQGADQWIIWLWKRKNTRIVGISETSTWNVSNSAKKNQFYQFYQFFKEFKKFFVENFPSKTEKKCPKAPGVISNERPNNRTGINKGTVLMSRCREEASLRIVSEIRKHNLILSVKGRTKKNSRLTRCPRKARWALPTGFD